jgi:hypothetical protein
VHGLCLGNTIFNGERIMHMKTLAVAVILTFAPGAAALAGAFQIIGGSQAQQAYTPAPQQQPPVVSATPVKPEPVSLHTAYHKLQIGGWHIHGAPSAICSALGGIASSGNANPGMLAEMLIAMTRQAGLVGYTANINRSAHSIALLKSTVVTKGSLSGYLHHTGTLKGLKASEPLLAAAAAANGGTASLSIGQSDNGVIPVSATIKNPGVRWSAGALLSSFGPRYAGSDVVSEYGAMRGYGYTGNLAFTEGLPTWTPTQSFGGSYHGVSGGITHPTDYGVFGITGQYATFKEGGIANVLGIAGTEGLVGLTYAYPINPNWRVHSGLYYGFQSEDLGLVGYTATQDFTAAKVGVSGDVHTGYKQGVIALEGNIWAGLTGHTTGILLGRPSSNSWQMGTFDASLLQPLPYQTAVQVEVGGQYAAGNLPEQEYFVLGGAWRGDSYYTGQAATPSGVYGGVRFYAPNIHHKLSGQEYAARPFVGVNGSDGTPLIGAQLEAASVDVGSKFQLSKYVSGEAGYAWSVDSQGPHKPLGRMFFEVTGSY